MRESGCNVKGGGGYKASHRGGGGKGQEAGGGALGHDEGVRAHAYTFIHTYTMIDT